MILTGLFPVMGVLFGLTSHQNHWIGLASFTWCTADGFWVIWYLMRPRVRYAFGQWHGEEESLPPGLTTKGKISVAFLASATTIGLFVLFLAIGIERDIASSDVYRAAMRRTLASPCASALIGTNITPGWFTSGGLSENAEEGSADLSIPIHGEKGKGTLSLVAKKHDGAWTFDSLILSTDAGQANLTVPGLPCE
jgi:Cytochrome oxidase complex assembly protein 1